ncbi:uncharacterized protein LAESUDRAFT_713986 [Laetiporus sulphureus 93-53]|uniref:Uncharacterized protein n=1 Tax=Laetiporus sulphureus 93-53 TaxID=1314785 RepID=A0A165EE75_9APHY|nr:uncharacterized protein LAESUDRAFT_713986 [Laetiporus sulphureus 93-53]KZT06849.1 hypothetical protein LAESUDRAFT_713986 [Laetiporus sulphureus 93-53]
MSSGFILSLYSADQQIRSTLKALCTYSDPETFCYSASTIPTHATWTRLPKATIWSRTLCLSSPLKIVVIGIIFYTPPPSRPDWFELTIDLLQTIDRKAMAHMLCASLKDLFTFTTVADELFDDMFDARTSLRKYRHEFLKTSDIVTLQFMLVQVPNVAYLI